MRWSWPSVVLLLSACASNGPSRAPGAPAPSAHETKPSRAVILPSSVTAQPAATPEEIAQARRLMDEGVGRYHEGDYDRAEALLKQAVTIYPFLADANLVLAKILLLRASAKREPALITDAQRMLEMAHSLDPGSREAAMLLELCKHPSAP